MLSAVPQSILAAFYKEESVSAKIINLPKSLSTAGREAQEAIAACDEDRANGIEPRDGASYALGSYIGRLLRHEEELDIAKWETLLLRLWAAGYLEGRFEQ